MSEIKGIQIHQFLTNDHARVRQMIEKMPAGELMADVGPIPAWREGIAAVEAPRQDADELLAITVSSIKTARTARDRTK